MVPYTKGLHQIADDVWAWLAPEGGWGWSNAGLIAGTDASVLVDTLFDLNLTREMLAAMTTVTDQRPIGDAVNTHANGDHCYGNILLPDSVRIHAAPEVGHAMHQAPPEMLATPTASMPHHLRKAAGEQALRHCEVPWTVLQPAMYVQTVSTTLAGYAKEGVVPVPWNLDTPFTPVHLGDVAEAAATVLTEPGHSHATYELAGPQVLSTREMIADLARTAGRELHPRHILPADLNLPGPSAAGLAAMCAEYDAHGFVGNANVLRWLLGREPLSFADACAADLTH